MSKVGPDEVQAAKAESLQKRADLVRHKTMWVAAGPPIYALSAILRGHGVDVADVAGATVGVGGLGMAVGKILENPKVSDFLTKATARDVAAIPEDLRGEFPMILKQAKTRGIKVSSALERSFQGAAVLGPRKPEQNPTDAWSNPDQQ